MLVCKKEVLISSKPCFFGFRFNSEKKQSEQLDTLSVYARSVLIYLSCTVIYWNRYTRYIAGLHSGH